MKFKAYADKAYKKSVPVLGHPVQS